MDLTKLMFWKKKKNIVEAPATSNKTKTSSGQQITNANLKNFVASILFESFTLY